MGNHEQGHAEGHHHVVPLEVNITVFLSLLVLTGLTVFIAGVDLGALNIFVAMLIATVKATIVFLWFMHLKYDGWVNRVVFGTALFFVGLFFVLTASDVFTR